jgi:hypothetical protein
LLLATDGLFMPLVRSRMDETNHRLTPGDLRAEMEIARLLAEADPTEKASLAVRWQRRAEHLAGAALQAGRRHRHYRDDIAFVLLHPSDEPVEARA